MTTENSVLAECRPSAIIGHLRGAKNPRVVRCVKAGGKVYQQAGAKPSHWGRQERIDAGRSGRSAGRECGGVQRPLVSPVLARLVEYQGGQGRSP